MRNPPARVRLVALDLDGTVVDKNLHVGPAVIEAIAAARARGITTTVVTGRMFRAARPFAAMLGITGPIVCYQGAGIYEAASGEMLRHTPLAHEVALRVVAFAKERGLHVQLYADDDFFVEQRSRFSALYAYVSGIEPTVVPSLEERFKTQDSTKVVLVADPDVAVSVDIELKNLLGMSAYVTRSNPEFVEVLAPNVDKGDALTFVADRLGVALEETIGVGDSWNDIPMLKRAGFGVVMGSAPDAAKQAADAAVADVEHDGVVEAYERFVFPVAESVSAR